VTDKTDDFALTEIEESVSTPVLRTGLMKGHIPAKVCDVHDESFMEQYQEKLAKAIESDVETSAGNVPDEIAVSGYIVIVWDVNISVGSVGSVYDTVTVSPGLIYIVPETLPEIIFPAADTIEKEPPNLE